MIEKPENEKSSKYYDEKTGKGRSYFQSPFHKTLYFSVVEFLSSDDKIIDLGCGAGRLLQGLQKKNKKPKKYLGIDFSSKRIKYAREAYRNSQWEFKVGDITKFDNIYTEFDTFVLVTVLEHINDDIAIIDNIPIGSKVVMANPNAWANAHVRKYDSIEYIEERYGKYLEFEDLKILYNKDSSPRMFIHKCWRIK